MKPPKHLISIITPCFNEAENIIECYKSVKAQMDGVVKNKNYNYEHIFVDNASTDDSKDIILGLRKSDKSVRYFRNNRNVGSINNIWIGLGLAKGDLVIPLIPADLQDPPELIGAFIESWESGYLVVQGIAISRQEFILMRTLRRFFYFIISRLSTTYLPKGANEFCAIDRKVVNSVLDTGDRKPYIRGLIHLAGGRTKYIEYAKRARIGGASKESIKSYLDISLNALVSTSVLFPRFLLSLGLMMSAFSIFVGFLIAFTSVRTEGFQSLFQVSNLIWVIFLLLGLQILFLGVVCEYIISIHNQVRPRPKSFFTDVTD